MPSDKVVQKLNEQIGHEFESSNLYLQMCAWCAENGYEGCATFFRAHGLEEQQHMFKIFDYLNEAGGPAAIPALAEQRRQFESIREIFDATLEHERFITGKINELAGLAFSENDFTTFNFLQWFIEEQREEEALFGGIIDRFNLVGDDGRGIYHLDREIGGIHGAAGEGGGEEGA
jgi:ferritin